MITKILTSAKRNFALHGFEGARIEEIAQEAEINKAMIYYHFKNKKALYEEVLSSFFYDSVADPRHFLEGEQKQELLFLMSNILRKMEENRYERCSLIAREMVSRGKTFQELRDKYWVPQFNVFCQTIRKGLNTGEFQTGEPVEFLAFTLVSNIAFYKISQVTYHGSEVYQKLYPQNYHIKIMQYMESVIDKLLISV